MTSSGEEVTKDGVHRRTFIHGPCHLEPTPARRPKRPRVEGALQPTPAPSAAARSGPCHKNVLTDLTSMDDNSASGPRHHSEARISACHPSMGVARIRITGKRKPSVLGPGPPSTATTADVVFTVQDCVTGVADKGSVGGASQLQPCERVHRDRGGGTRFVECSGLHGIDVAPVAAAVEGEMNTLKFTLPSSSCSASSATSTGNVAASGAPAARSSSSAAARSCPPECAG